MKTKLNKLLDDVDHFQRETEIALSRDYPGHDMPNLYEAVRTLSESLAYLSQAVRELSKGGVK